VKKKFLLKRNFFIFTFTKLGLTSLQLHHQVHTVTNQFKVIDEEGNRYGRLVVRCHIGPAPENNGALWLCDCDCGGERTVLGTELRSGRARECRDCASISRRLARALAAVGPAPCERDCPMVIRCKDDGLACKVFVQWVEQKGALKNAEPDPARWMPSRELFRAIYGE